jgi:hypothetical protein
MHKPKQPTPAKPPYNNTPDKAAMSRNLSNPHGYQSNGFKKHRDQTPV